MKILGIDPGYAIVGYGVVDCKGMEFRPISYGTVTTLAKTDFTDRIEQIYDGICQIITKYNVDSMSIEKLFFNTNSKTAIDVAEARGVILLAAKKFKVPIFEYTPLQVKQSVTGYGRAEKNQVIDMTKMILGLPKPPRPDDAADALALAICHGHSAGSLLTRLKKEEKSL